MSIVEALILFAILLSTAFYLIQKFKKTLSGSGSCCSEGCSGTETSNSSGCGQAKGSGEFILKTNKETL
ncbi:MAG: hypothetical protein HQM12_10000 [SAR324 cluster bacterium]|nr:hypothetical protein [SAR324 cluster bacterium]